MIYEVLVATFLGSLLVSVLIVCIRIVELVVDSGCSCH